MNIINKIIVDDAFNYFQIEKIITLLKLSELLHSSVITARRYLKSWDAYTSYNQKGLYHTLPDIPNFDDNGLWFFGNARFTSHRTLRNTIVHLLRHSKAGMDSEEIGQTVGLEPSSFMHHFRDIAGVKREKFGERFVYFLNDLEIGTKQKEERMFRLLNIETPISDADAIALLILFINNPGDSAEGLAIMLNEQSKMVKSMAVRQFLERHDLLKKIPDYGQYAVLKSIGGGLCPVFLPDSHSRNLRW